jgi:hypothetical protein
VYTLKVVCGIAGYSMLASVYPEKNYAMNVELDNKMQQVNNLILGKISSMLPVPDRTE